MEKSLLVLVLWVLICGYFIAREKVAHGGIGQINILGVDMWNHLDQNAQHLEGFPSGQRGQTVNLLAQPSKVRILPPPPYFRWAYR